MDNSIIASRSKALKGLSGIVTVDPSILTHVSHSQSRIIRFRSVDVLNESKVSVRNAIEKRLSDSSSLVRDAAVELVGNYVTQKPTVAAEYYPHLVLRIH